MNNEPDFPKVMPRAEVLRKMAQRYPDLQTSAMEVVLTILRVANDKVCSNKSALELHGLSEGRFYVLVDIFSEELLGHEDPSPSDIAEHLGVSRATVTGLLDGLERDGYLKRQHDSSDRRALTIRIEDKTREFMDAFIPTQFRMMNAAMSPLNEQERSILMDLLTRIAIPAACAVAE